MIMFFLKASANILFHSIAVISGHPREANSKLILPVPENRSNTRMDSKSTRFQRILNRASLALSVVGLASILVGRTGLLPLRIPFMIRTRGGLVAG